MSQCAACAGLHVHFSTLSVATLKRASSFFTGLTDFFNQTLTVPSSMGQPELRGITIAILILLVSLKKSLSVLDALSANANQELLASQGSHFTPRSGRLKG